MMTGSLICAVDQVDGTWRAVLECHEPCRGDKHRDCTVAMRIVSPPCASEVDAMALALESRDDFAAAVVAGGATLASEWRMPKA
jgi:hypothetical protein